MPIPWATQVTYKFHITYDNGAADAYLPDPSNPTQVDDGFGGKNSVFTGTTCETWTCASTQIACAGTPLAAHSFDWRDAVIYWAFVDRFVNGDATNDTPIADPKLTGNAANWQGGDWAGLTVEDHRAATSRRSASTPCGSPVPMDNADSVGQGTQRRHQLVHRLSRLLAARSDQDRARTSAPSAELQTLVGARRTRPASRCSSTTR